MYIHDRQKKIWQTGGFKEKPETGQNLSWKFFSTKISKFIHMFDGIIEISIDRAVFSISNTWSNEITTTTK